MREWVKVALGVLAITLGASAPTLILESVYFRSIYQTEQPRDWNIKSSDQEASRRYPENQAPTPSPAGTDTTNAQVAQRHTAAGTTQSQQNHSNPEPSWVPVAQGLSAIAGLIVAVVIAGINFAQWAVYKSQARIMMRQLVIARTSTRAAQTSAAAAMQTAETMENTAKRQLRAYLSADPRYLYSFDENTPPRIRYTIINHGQTPAYDMVSLARVEILPYPLPDNWPFPEPPTTAPSRSTIYPGAPKRADTRAQRVFSAEEIEKVVQGNEQRIYSYGIITYRDIFGEAHRTRFCWSVEGGDLIKMVAQGLHVEDMFFEHPNQHNEAT